MDHSEKNGCECTEAQMVDPYAPCFCLGEDPEDAGPCQCYGVDPYDTDIEDCQCWGYFELPDEQYYALSDPCFCHFEADVNDEDSLCYCIHNDIWWDADYSSCICQDQDRDDPEHICYCWERTQTDDDTLPCYCWG